MAKLTIPQRSREGLSKLLGLRPEAFDQLVVALEALRPNLGLPSRLPDSVVLQEVSKTDLDQIGTAVISLYVVRVSRTAPLESFVDDVAEAIATYNSIASSEESKRRLTRILSIESLAIASKTLVIFTDYQRTLYPGSKILTDLRYIFQDDPKQDPHGAVIVHLLKLTYHEAAEHKEFFVAMDDKDLASLENLIERAKEKASTLRKKLKAANTEYLGDNE